MPLILHENTENGKIGLWSISEELDELLSLAKLSLPDTVTYYGISATHRKKEWLATRALLNKLITETRLIKYHNDGRPYLENCPINISITHSTGYVAILLHGTSLPGIDIELITRKVGRVASRFLSPDESAACSENGQPSNRLLLLHWCAKEAIFKMIPLSEIEFSSDISILISDTTADSGSFQGTFNAKPDKVTITLYYRIVNEILIVWGWTDKVRFKL
jgi:4'-phosphopantetheinyl transferase